MSRGQRLYGIADYHAMNDLAKMAIGGTCLVDGVEIQLCHYIDTQAGIVKTYDLNVDGIPAEFRDGKPHSSREVWRAWEAFLDPDAIVQDQFKIPKDWEMPEDGVVSRTLHGAVELYAKAE